MFFWCRKNHLWFVWYNTCSSKNIVVSSFWSKGFMIIKESVEKYKLDFDTHVYYSTVWRKNKIFINEINTVKSGIALINNISFVFLKNVSLYASFSFSNCAVSLSIISLYVSICGKLTPIELAYSFRVFLEKMLLVNNALI